VKVSTLILTLNEERNLPACLTALSWCDDIVVLDSGSTDTTLEIARAHGARILDRKFDTFAGQRNFGLEAGVFRHEWVLHLDADEVVTPAFVAQLTTLAPAPGVDAWRVPSKTMLFGRWLKHAGMYPTYQVRLGHRDRLRFKQVGHGQREDLPAERVATFAEPYLHYNFSHGMRSWLLKHVRYAEDEAREIIIRRNGAYKENVGSDATSRRRGAKALAARLPLWLRPIARVVYVLVLRQGFRDGRAGLAYAIMMGVYEGMTAIFVYDALLSERQSRPETPSATNTDELKPNPVRKSAGQ
jgi:hypothetical protein